MGFIIFNKYRIKQRGMTMPQIFRMGEHRSYFWKNKNKAC